MPRLFFKTLIIALAASSLFGCTTIEYYGYLEPQRTSNTQFIDMPYIYSGKVVVKKARGTLEWYNYQFSGALHDTDDKFLNLRIPSNLSIKEHQMVSKKLDAKLRKDQVTISNGDKELMIGEPALLVINPGDSFDMQEIKQNPKDFFRRNYRKDQEKRSNSRVACPHIILLNIDIFEEEPTTIEFGHCDTNNNNYSDVSQFIWEDVGHNIIRNYVEHDKPFGYQIGYLGFLVTLPLDIIVTPIYTLGWGLLATKNLLMDEDY
jgi:hypothetical protein